MTLHFVSREYEDLRISFTQFVVSGRSHWHAKETGEEDRCSRKSRADAAICIDSTTSHKFAH